MSDSVQRCRRQATRLPRPWDSPGKNTGVGCHFLLQCMKVKSESEVAQPCPTLRDPMDCSPPGSSTHGIFQARVLEWCVIAFYAHLQTMMQIGNKSGQTMDSRSILWLSRLTIKWVMEDWLEWEGSRYYWCPCGWGKQNNRKNQLLAHFFSLSWHLPLLVFLHLWACLPSPIPPRLTGLYSPLLTSYCSNMG